MKRIGFLLLAAAFILSLSACGSSSSSSSLANGSTAGHSSSETLGEMIDEVIPDTDYSRLRTGLGIVTSTKESVAAAPGMPGNARFSTTVCALTVRPDGTIVNVKFDTAEAGLSFDTSGTLTGDVAQEIRTKKELGDSYGMKAASDIGKEWYEQIAALENWMQGKMVSDALAMRVIERESDKMMLPDEPDLKTSVTIAVTDQLRALEKAYADAQG